LRGVGGQGSGVAGGEAGQDRVVLAAETVVLADLRFPEIAAEAVGIEEGLSGLVADGQAPGVVSIAILYVCVFIYNLADTAEPIVQIEVSLGIGLCHIAIVLHYHLPLGMNKAGNRVIIVIVEHDYNVVYYHNCGDIITF